MKKFIFSVTIILLIGTGCFAQKNKKMPETVENENPAKNNSSGQNTNEMKDLPLKAGTSLDAQLQGTLDVKKSKIGDEVVLKTTKTIKENGEVVVPKGTKLIGRITEIQQKTKNNTTSKIGLVFDKIEGKDLSSPINASIISITNVSNDAAVEDLFSSNSSTNSNSSGSVSGGNSGGGLLGGATQTVGGVLNNTTQTVGSVTNTAGQTVGGVTNKVGNSVKGLQINQSVSGSANSSTTLSSQDKNLKIEKGANFQLQLNKLAGN